MPEEIRKRSISRSRRAAASAPTEGGATPVESVGSGSTCGHEGCAPSPSCNVRYVGPMSHVSDHHSAHAARGVGHMWAASIITGFAVVLTGVIAFQSVQAKSEQGTDANRQASAIQVKQLNARLENLEKLMLQTKAACVPSRAPAPDADGSVPNNGLRGRQVPSEAALDKTETASTTTEAQTDR